MRRNESVRRLSLLAILVACAAPVAVAAQPLHALPASDLVVLNGLNNSAKLEVIPNPSIAPGQKLPEAGMLRTRLMIDPAREVEIPYSSIVSYRTFPERLLEAAIGHGRQGEFGSAYDYFARLEIDYPDHPGFRVAFTAALRAEARRRQQAGEYDHALALLQTLATQYRRSADLRESLNTLGDQILAAQWKERNFAGVQGTIQLLETQFPTLRLDVVKRWKQRLAGGADEQRQRAQQLADQGRAREALRALTGALRLDPESPETRRLLRQISAYDQTLWVGVWQATEPGDLASLANPAARRLRRLFGGALVSVDGFSASGGEYTPTVNNLQVEAGRTRISLDLGDAQQTAELARVILTGSRGAAAPLSLLRRQASSVGVDPQGRLMLQLRAPHPEPSALLASGLPPEAVELASGDWRRGSTSENAAVRYERQTKQGVFQAIEEYVYDDFDDAIEALRERQLHLINDIPPWRLQEVEELDDVRLTPQRFPTIHCLLISPDSPIRDRREVRRAICYGLAREVTLQALLLGGDERPGFQVLSAPLPAGLSVGDALRYAYNDSVEPRPYDPRLAALLLTAAQAAEKAAQEALAGQGGAFSMVGMRAPKTITLAHRASPVVQLACEAIKKQLEAIGLAVTLQEASEAEFEQGEIEYDLRYAELSITEPMVDAWRLLGPGGLSGGCSPAVEAALDLVAGASNGKQAAQALRDLHRVLFAELPVIPLWQTVNYIATSDALTGVPNEPADLYQQIEQWNVSGGPR